MLADVVTIGCKPLSSSVRARRSIFSFSSYLQLQFFKSAAVPGWTFNEFQHSSKPSTLVAILKTTPSYLNICMVRRLFILLTTIGLNISSSFACDCYYNGPFLKMAQRTPFVALVRVTKYLTFKDIYNSKTPMSMEIEIIDIYKGKENRNTVTVWGDIGNLCRPYLSTFKEGQYYVIALDNGNYGGGHPNEKNTDYSICGCGCYWIPVDFEKLIVKGDIESKDMKSTTLKLPELKAKLTQNGY